MPDWAWILIAVAALVVAAIVVWALMTRRQRERRERLEGQFGPEYERTVSSADSRRTAEAELDERLAKRERLDIVPLTPEARDRYADAWRQTQTRFVDDPPGALDEADRLVGEVMRERGYPMDDFEQRAGDISVDHPDVVENYRAAHTIYLESERGEADTEDMRQGLVHYRALFEELLESADERTGR